MQLSLPVLRQSPRFIEIEQTVADLSSSLQDSQNFTAELQRELERVRAALDILLRKDEQQDALIEELRQRIGGIDRQLKELSTYEVEVLVDSPASP